MAVNYAPVQQNFMRGFSIPDKQAIEGEAIRQDTMKIDQESKKLNQDATKLGMESAKLKNNAMKADIEAAKANAMRAAKFDEKAKLLSETSDPEGFARLSKELVTINPEEATTLIAAFDKADNKAKEAIVAQTDALGDIGMMITTADNPKQAYNQAIAGKRSTGNPADAAIADALENMGYSEGIGDYLMANATESIELFDTVTKRMKAKQNESYIKSRTNYWNSKTTPAQKSDYWAMAKDVVSQIDPLALGDTDKAVLLPDIAEKIQFYVNEEGMTKEQAAKKALSDKFPVVPDINANGEEVIDEDYLY